ncbi:MAG: NAD(+)/NADH kinase [Bacteroidales bacterium]|jgi:NAD+ kinase|nr:NAD(+)/NADH kinase [Bacteroidales bacterium]
MIALFSTNVKTEDIEYIQLLINQIESHHFKIRFYEPFYLQIKDHIRTHSHNIFNNAKDLRPHDYLFSLGGDGTLLSAAALLLEGKHKTDVPILGINFGRLGFLTSVGKNELDNLLSDIENQRYNLEFHSLLRWKDNFALNEVCLRSSKAGKMLDVDVFVDDKFLTTYTSDGIIVATPTGSTAYSLSCGGPIISPKVKCFCITPIAPHNLTFRPLVVTDTQQIRLEVKSIRCDVSLHLDSRSFVLNKKETVSLQKADFDIKLMRLQNHTFFTAIGNKLMWGTNLLT